MTIGFPTIIIPAIQGGDARNTGKDEFTLSKEDISLISKYFFITIQWNQYFYDYVFMLHSSSDWYGFSNTIVRANWRTLFTRTLSHISFPKNKYCFIAHFEIFNYYLLLRYLFWSKSRSSNFKNSLIYVIITRFLINALKTIKYRNKLRGFIQNLY